MCDTSSSQIKAIFKLFSKCGSTIELKTLLMKERGRIPNRESGKQSGLGRQIVSVIEIFYSLVLALISNSPAHIVLLVRT